MRALILTPGLDGADGIASESRQTVRALARGAARVEVWALAGGEPAWDPPLARPIGFRSARGSRVTFVRWTLARLWRPADDLLVVAAHVQLAPPAAIIGLRGARTLVYLNGVEAWRPLRMRERLALGRVHRLLAISAHTARRFRASHPDLGDRPITVCHLGVPAPPARTIRPHIAGYALIVGRLAAVERYKGHDLLIDIWADVCARAPDAVLVVVGDGDDRPRLERLTAERGLTGRVRFTGRVSDEELAGLYQAAAVFVMPSTEEGFGLVYLEAMRSGIPCVSVHGPADEFIESGENGVVVDAGARDALIDALVLLLTDGERRARMGAAAAARVAAEFSEEAFERRLWRALELVPTEDATGAPAMGRS